MKELDDLFSVYENTMSAHLRSNSYPMVKYGNPGSWKLQSISDKKFSIDDLEDIRDIIDEYASQDSNTFYEENTDIYQVIQLDNYRIVITYPPFSDALEITIVRPTIKRTLSEYNLPKLLQKRLDFQAEGILIAGAPGHGKSTFASALAIYYANNVKIIKTIEKPRDLQLDERITQFTILEHNEEKVGDLLLLMRPDYVIYDEIRKNSDFDIYSDMRLAGVGMVGVIHATKPIDAIQRFVNRVELGLIPSIIDTVIFIKNGEVDKILSLKMVVKTPRGFNDNSLSRPVIEVKDFLKGTELYEIFSFGEQIVVIPLNSKPSTKKKSINRIIAEEIMYKYPLISNKDIELRKIDRYNINIMISEEFFDDIAQDYELLENLELSNNVTISITSGHKEKSNLKVISSKKYLILQVSKNYSQSSVNIYLGPQYIMDAYVDEYAEIKLPRKKATTKRLERLIENSESVLTVREI